MHAPALQRLITAIESTGLNLGDVPIRDPEQLAMIVEVAARNRATGRRRLQRERADVEEMQNRNNARSFAVESDLPVE